MARRQLRAIRTKHRKINYMKKTLQRIGMGLVFGAVALCASQSSAITLNYSSTIGSEIQFAGDGTFSFAPAVNNFQITSLGAAVGLLGEMTGTYTIGAGVLSAPVTGTGTFTIHDGFGFNLTGALTWLSIQQNGTGGSLNIVGNINVTGVTYGGVNPALLKLVPQDVNTLSFQFDTIKTLNDLRTVATATSFSGSITSVPDGGTTVMLLGAALSTLGLVRRKIA